MSLLTRTRVKYAFAGIGAVYLVGFAGYLIIHAATKKNEVHGPSELEAHPERQDEILARQRADRLRDQLKLTDDQSQRIAEIMKKNRPDPSGPGDPRAPRPNRGWRAAQQEIAQVLTPEQQQQMDQTRGQFGRPGGPRGSMSPERIESLKQKMTPEQQARFDKKVQQWQQRRSQRGNSTRPRRGPGPSQ